MSDTTYLLLVVGLIIGGSLLWLLIRYLIRRAIDSTVDGISNKIIQKKIDKGKYDQSENLADRYK